MKYCTDLVIVNSSWTEKHMLNILQYVGGNKPVTKIYPPCNTTELLCNTNNRNNASSSNNNSSSTSSSNNSSSTRTPCIISIGQFRPEKDHLLQINAFHTLLVKYKHHRNNKNIRMLIIGSVRNEGDERILRQCKDRIKELSALSECHDGQDDLDFENRIQLKVNVEYSEIIDAVRNVGCVGLHTMWNEHFGISVVEMLAAGLMVVAHNSGGPMMDIITDIALGLNSSNTLYNGFLASSPDEYADCMSLALDIYLRSDHPSMDLAANPNPSPSIASYQQFISDATDSIDSRFSDETFKDDMCSAFAPFLE